MADDPTSTAVALKATTRAPDDFRVRLRSAVALAGVEVDRERSIIRNASILSVGDASGHYFVIDETTLRQCADRVNKRSDPANRLQRCRVRLGHPSFLGDALGTVVGHATNARVEGLRVRADIEIFEAACRSCSSGPSSSSGASGASPCGRSPGSRT